jgi:hypothetical protein
MTDQTTEERPRRGHFSAKPETLALLKASGNPINGLGETVQRRPSPFFWHPPNLHPFGDLQVAARSRMSKCPGYETAFAPARNHPPLAPIAEVQKEGLAEEFTAAVREFALSHEADDIGITPMDPLYVFEGYAIEEPTVIMLAVGHNYERLKQVPSDETNGEGIADVGDQVRAGHALVLRTGQLDSLPGLYRKSVSWPIGRCTASDSGGCSVGPGRAGQTWLDDQPKIRCRCAPCRRHHGHAVGDDDGRPLWRGRILQELPGMHQGMSPRRYLRTKANGAGSGALVRRLRQVHSRLHRSGRLCDLYRRVPLDKACSTPETTRNHGPASRPRIGNAKRACHDRSTFKESGANSSNDHRTHWQHPPSRRPPAGHLRISGRRDQPANPR